MEAAILALLIAVFAVAGPVLAVAVGRSAYHAAAQAARGGRHQVTAVLLADSAYPELPIFGDLGLVQVSARWTAPDGVQRHGRVAALPGSRAGSKVTTWLDASGLPAGPPVPGWQVAGQGWLAGAMAGGCVVLVVSFAWLLARGWLDRRRLAAWEAAWRAAATR